MDNDANLQVDPSVIVLNVPIYFYVLLGGLWLLMIILILLQLVLMVSFVDLKRRSVHSRRSRRSFRRDLQV